MIIQFKAIDLATGKEVIETGILVADNGTWKLVEVDGRFYSVENSIIIKGE